MGESKAPCFAQTCEKRPLPELCGLCGVGMCVWEAPASAVALTCAEIFLRRAVL